MVGLLSCPPEVTVLIICSCDSFRQASSLASTCRVIWSAWKSNSGSIITTLGLRVIPAFETALIAVRATHMVQSAFSEGILAPDVGPLERLTVDDKKPTPAELRDVLALEHLVKCLEYILNHDSPPRESDARPNEFCEYGGNPVSYGLTYQPRRFHERFRRVVYELFLAGAALSRAYNEPFFRPDSPPRGFAVYAREANDEKEAAVFEPLAGWLVARARSEAIRSKYIRHRHPDSLALHGPNPDDDPELEMSAPDYFVQKELMCMAKAYEHIQNKFWEPARVGRMDYATRKTKVVLFGDFRLHEITMPAAIPGMSANGSMPTIKLVGSPVRPHRLNDFDPYSWDIWRTLEWLPQPPGHGIDTNPAWHAQLQFIAYALRVYLNRELADEAMDLTDSVIHCAYREWITSSETFLDRDHWCDDVGEGMLKKVK